MLPLSYPLAWFGVCCYLCCCGGWSLVGAEIASEGLKGRVFEFSLGDLNNDEDLVSERFRLTRLR